MAYPFNSYGRPYPLYPSRPGLGLNGVCPYGFAANRDARGLCEGVPERDAVLYDNSVAIRGGPYPQGLGGYYGPNPYTPYARNQIYGSRFGREQLAPYGAAPEYYNGNTGIYAGPSVVDLDNPGYFGRNYPLY